VKKLLTIEQASERTQLSPKAVRMKIWRKEFPVTRLGGRVFVEESQLERYLELAMGTTAEEAAAKIAERAA